MIDGKKNDPGGSKFPLIFCTSQTPAAGVVQSIAALKKNSQFVCHEFLGPLEALPLISGGLAGIAIICLGPKDDLKGVTTFLDAASSSIKADRLRVFVVLKVDHPKIREFLIKTKGVSEVFDFSLTKKNLEYKINRFYEQQSRTKKVATAAAEDTSSKAKDVQWIDALELADDVWFLRDLKDARFILGKWRIDMDGPDPAEGGEWLSVKIKSDPKRTAWEWKPPAKKNRDSYLNFGERGRWVFFGENPVYSEVKQRWHFAGGTPSLAWFMGEKPQAYRFDCIPPATLAIARNSKTAKARQQPEWRVSTTKTDPVTRAKESQVVTVVRSSTTQAAVEKERQKKTQLTRVTSSPTLKRQESSEILTIVKSSKKEKIVAEPAPPEPATQKAASPLRPEIPLRVPAKPEKTKKQDAWRDYESGDDSSETASKGESYSDEPRLDTKKKTMQLGEQTITWGKKKRRYGEQVVSASETKEKWNVRGGKEKDEGREWNVHSNKKNDTEREWNVHVDKKKDTEREWNVHVDKKKDTEREWNVHDNKKKDKDREWNAHGSKAEKTAGWKVHDLEDAVAKSDASFGSDFGEAFGAQKRSRSKDSDTSSRRTGAHAFARTKMGFEFQFSTKGGDYSQAHKANIIEYAQNGIVISTQAKPLQGSQIIGKIWSRGEVSADVEIKGVISSTANGTISIELNTGFSASMGQLFANVERRQEEISKFLKDVKGV